MLLVPDASLHKILSTMGSIALIGVGGIDPTCQQCEVVQLIGERTAKQLLEFQVTHHTGEVVDITKKRDMDLSECGKRTWLQLVEDAITIEGESRHMELTPEHILISRSLAAMAAPAPVLRYAHVV